MHESVGRRMTSRGDLGWCIDRHVKSWVISTLVMRWVMEGRVGRCQVVAGSVVEVHQSIIIGVRVSELLIESSEVEELVPSGEVPEIY
jgi:hypothetical protein